MTWVTSRHTGNGRFNNHRASRSVDNLIGVKTRAPSHEPDGTSRMSLSTEIVAKNDSQKLTHSAVIPFLHSSLPYLVFG